MSEFRQDIISKNWILIAETRGRRPDDFKRFPATPDNLPERDESCDFCAGNEERTPARIAAYPADEKAWQVRVVPNKYEALSHESAPEHKNLYSSRPGIGDHEVVITRAHNQPTALQNVSLIDLTLRVYIDRINELKKHEEVRYVHIIQNHGVQAGASLVHPHSQIFAIPFLPDRLQDELSGTRTYYNLHGQCVYCEVLKYETRKKTRVVLETRDFLVMTPYASKAPFQMRIMPKQHRSRFEEITDRERENLAAVMKEIFSRLYERLGNPAYNYYFHTCPCGPDPLTRSHHDANSYHWHMVIMPRVNVWAGFELGTEIYVNPVSPESAAKLLR